MKHKIENREYIAAAIQTCRFAILATEGDGQPHASLIAISANEGIRELIFATYRNTCKYTNMFKNEKVAVLIQNDDCIKSNIQESSILTAYGKAEEISVEANETIFRAHLEKHPDLESFIQSKDCALIRIAVNAYQVVRGIEDVQWWAIDDLDTSTI